MLVKFDTINTKKNESISNKYEDRIIRINIICGDITYEEFKK